MGATTTSREGGRGFAKIRTMRLDSLSSLCIIPIRTRLLSCNLAFALRTPCRHILFLFGLDLNSCIIRLYFKERGMVYSRHRFFCLIVGAMYAGDY
jgi:hypothetical protein